MNAFRTFAFLSAFAVLPAFAGPRFLMPERICAVPGVECRVHYARLFDSLVPFRYSIEAISKVGHAYSDHWSLTATEREAGQSHRLVLNAWDDTGLVAAGTTTVVIARQVPAAVRARPVSLALLAASDTNSLYQDRLRDRMREAGFAGYRPVGSHTGYSASSECDPAKGAPHDGYGGFTWGSFLTRYALSPEEIDNVQSEAEREQLKRFGEKIPEGQGWRKALLKSPLVRLVDGKRTIDIPAWFDRINGGRAPDYIVIALGGNSIWSGRPETCERIVNAELENARRLVGLLREAAPDTVIGITSSMGGSMVQEGWGRNYGAAQSWFWGHRSFCAYNEAIKALCESFADGRVRYVPLAQGVDPIGSYPRTIADGNALHATAEGGRQMGDALFAWLLNDIIERNKCK